MVADFFDFYEIPQKFFINEEALKSKFLLKAKQNHPDFYVNDQEKYADAMEQTSLNNQAFKVLSKFDSRLEYILKRYGLLEESKNEIPQDFLVEMMDINEVIMDLQFDFDLEKMEEVKSKIHAIGEDLEYQINSLSKEFDKLEDNLSQESNTILEQIRNRYLKQKYVLRLRESLDKFAPL